MDERQLIGHVDELIAEEHTLREKGSLTDEERSRLSDIEMDLDQCWDLLRQRRARQEFGEDPDKAKLRPHSEVEGYLQ